MIKHAIYKLKHTYPFLDRLYVILTLPTGTLYFSSTYKEAKEKFKNQSCLFFKQKKKRNPNLGKIKSELRRRDLPPVVAP